MAYRRVVVQSFRRLGREPFPSGSGPCRCRSACQLAAGGMLAVTPELDFVSGLLAVLAAVLSERTMGFDDALTGGVRALRC